MVGSPSPVTEGAKRRNLDLIAIVAGDCTSAPIAMA
jgi:hypothetical protein